jgi:hypothetical protein
MCRRGHRLRQVRSFFAPGMASIRGRLLDRRERLAESAPCGSTARHGAALSKRRPDFDFGGGTRVARGASRGARRLARLGASNTVESVCVDTPRAG